METTQPGREVRTAGASSRGTPESALRTSKPNFLMYDRWLNRIFAVPPEAAPPPSAASLAAALLLAVLLSWACAGGLAGRAPQAIRILSQPETQATAGYCAWYASPRDGVLYFGQAAFWSAFRRAGGDPRADLDSPGPQWIGRLRFAGPGAPELLPPLDVTASGARSGVWDVLPHPNGWIYYTTFFEAPGRVHAQRGVVERFPELGHGLNELALGPDGTILASRYGSSDGGNGSLVRLSEDGRRLAEHELSAPPGYVAATKSVAWDPARNEYWVNTDLVPRGDAPVRYDARILDASGREIARIERPEIQFMSFRPDGVGLSVEAEDSQLWLRVLRPDDPLPMPERGRRILLDDAFHAGADFAQDIQWSADGRRAVVMRWSGRFHTVDLADPAAPVVRRGALRREGAGIFYSAVPSGDEICATLCAGVSVVCAPAPR